MNFLKLKNINCVCFTKTELSELFKSAKKQEMSEEMKKHGYSFDDLRRDYSKMEQLATIVGEKGAQHRDEHEIFASLFIFIVFYGKDAEVCFELDNTFDPNKNHINSLADLNKFRKGASDSDFIIKSQGNFRKFQLKRYRGNMSTQDLFDFIQKKIKHYGNDLGDTNLLVQLQPPAFTATKLDFHEIHKNLQALNLKFQGQILISYNQADQEHLIIQVYPELAKTKVPINYPSAQLN